VGQTRIGDTDPAAIFGAAALNTNRQRHRVKSLSNAGLRARFA
jgi:hypothetical protein